jgi:hypothetical protein
MQKLLYDHGIDVDVSEQQHQKEAGRRSSSWDGSLFVD